MEASESDETVLVLVSLLSGEALAEFAAPKRSTVHDVKTRLRDQEGTPVRKQQLVYGCDILPDTVCLAELGSSDKLELRLVRKEAINFQWQATVGDGNCITSPEWCLDSSEAVSSRRCALSLRYYPTGFESKMLKDGNFSIMVQRPKSSILHARVHIAGVMRERLFTSAHGTLEGWINFASQEVLPSCETQQIGLEVLHCSMIPPPACSGSQASWDLRDALGRMPYAIGVPFVEEARIQSHELTPIHLRLAFFPGGHTAAPKNHVSVWVSPLQGLEDRSYVCSVDGSSPQRASGETVLHFPRLEVFGEISLSVCRLPSPDSPRRLHQFECG
ncbi:unnamed protein product [Durusdinium trenchii]|uniref:Ubiquitin-like domain-containing protein n=1 Tax=Durusdinium trenchii TaxID=1381693 RepID=A0ABP0N4L2_9DINO